MRWQCKYIMYLMCIKNLKPKWYFISAYYSVMIKYQQDAKDHIKTRNNSYDILIFKLHIPIQWDTILYILKLYILKFHIPIKAHKSNVAFVVTVYISPFPDKYRYSVMSLFSNVALTVSREKSFSLALYLLKLFNLILIFQHGKVESKWLHIAVHWKWRDSYFIYSQCMRFRFVINYQFHYLLLHEFDEVKPNSLNSSNRDRPLSGFIWTWTYCLYT